MKVIGACALAHLINDLIQAVLPSIYPMLKANYGLSFTQVGLITLTFQLTASLLQPWVGYHTDRHPKPWLLPAGMVCTLIGILLLAFAASFASILPPCAKPNCQSAQEHCVGLIDECRSVVDINGQRGEQIKNPPLFEYLLPIAYR